MKKNSARAMFAVVTLGSALAVSGCGGGGGSGDGTASMMGPDQEPPAPPPRAVLEPGPGLHLSDAAPVQADTADKTILAAQEGGDTIPTLSAVITRDTAQSTTAVSTSGSRVKSVRSDGDGGFHVIFVDGDVETPIHFERGDFVSSGASYQKDIDDTTYWLWRHSLRFSENDLTLRNRDYLRNRDREYLAALGGQAGDLQSGFERFYFVFGTRTPAMVTSRGSASFEGTLWADSWDAGNHSSSQRQRHSGHMRLVANFDLGTLEGHIRSIRGSEPGEMARSLWPTSSFRIADGKFNEAGQFTATLTGHDSAETPSLGESAAGYVGELLGEFYGPRADEIGAVLNATRDVEDDAHDRVLQGYVGGQRVIGAYTDDAPFSTGVDRHDTNTSSPRVVSQGADNRVTSVTSDGVGGYRIAYLVDGQPRSVNLEPEDVPRAGNDASYAPRDGAMLRYWRPFDSKYSSVAIWSHNRYANAESDEWVFGTWGHVIHGSRTPSASIPATGGATYTGFAGAYEWEPSPVSASVLNTPYYEGSLSLRADFTAGTVEGEISNLRRRPMTGSPFAPVSGQFAIGNGEISGNALSGELSGLGYSGEIRGAFYGPAAEEAAGVMEATDADDKMLHGWFRGRKQ